MLQMCVDMSFFDAFSNHSKPPTIKTLINCDVNQMSRGFWKTTCLVKFEENYYKTKASTTLETGRIKPPVTSKKFISPNESQSLLRKFLDQIVNPNIC